MIAESSVFLSSMRRPGALKFAMQGLRRRTGLFGRRFDLSFAEPLAAETAVRSERTVAAEADSGKTAGFVEGIQGTAAVVAELESFAAVLGLDSLCIEVGADLHQNS